MDANPPVPVPDPEGKGAGTDSDVRSLEDDKLWAALLAAGFVGVERTRGVGTGRVFIEIFGDGVGTPNDDCVGVSMSPDVPLIGGGCRSKTAGSDAGLRVDEFTTEAGEIPDGDDEIFCCLNLDIFETRRAGDDAGSIGACGDD